MTSVAVHCGRGSPPTWSPTSPRRWPRTCELSTCGDGPRRGRSRPTSPSWSAPTPAARRIRDALVAAGVPAVMHGSELGLRLRRGRGLADPADRARAAPAGAVRAGRADLLLRLDLRRAGRRPTSAALSRPDPAGPLVEPGAGQPRRRRPARDDRDRRHRRARSGCSADSGGERRLTDLRHLGQSLHAAMIVRPARRQRPGRVAAGPDGRGARRRTAPRAPGGWRPTRGRSGPDRAPQQGTGVPGRLPARGLGPARQRRTTTGRSCGCTSSAGRPASRASACSTSAAGAGPGRARPVAPAARPRRPARTSGCSTSR